MNLSDEKIREIANKAVAQMGDIFYEPEEGSDFEKVELDTGSFVLPESIALEQVEGAIKAALSSATLSNRYHLGK